MKSNDLFKSIFGDHDKSFVAQEKRTAKSLKAQLRAGSGNSMYAKGDVISENFLIECKTTEKKSIRITAQWLDKISHEAMVEEKHPALVFSMDFNSNITDKDWIAIPMSVFKKMELNDVE